MLDIGDRVRVVGHAEWQEGVIGVVAPPEPFQVSLAKLGEWQRCRRVVQGRTRPIIFYFILFDEPQDDGSGDGPYRGGEIDETYLEPIEDRDTIS